MEAVERLAAPFAQDARDTMVGAERRISAEDKARLHTVSVWTTITRDSTIVRPLALTSRWARLPADTTRHRLAHVHANAPGVLATINGLMGDHGVNIDAQSLAADALVAVPRLGTISPWSSKATEIVRGAGLPVARVERGIAYRIAGVGPGVAVLRECTGSCWRGPCDS